MLIAPLTTRVHIPAQRLRRVSGAPLLVRLAHYQVATQSSGPDMRLFPSVPRRVPPARAVSGPTSFSLPALLRAVERISVCPRRFCDPGCPVQAPAGHRRTRPVPGRSHRAWSTLDTESRAAQPALVTPHSLSAFACPAPLRVACRSFGFVDTDLHDGRCGRCRQSVEPANTSLLTARRLRPAGLRPASRRLSRRSSKRT